MQKIYSSSNVLSYLRQLILSFLLCFAWFTSLAADIRAEAEEAALTGVTVATTLPGYSGTGYVTGFDNANDKIVFTVQAPAGLYDLTIVYSAPFGEKGYDLQVNDEKGGGMFSLSNGFSPARAGKFMLTEGDNVITIGNGWGYFHIDYILLVPSVIVPPLKPAKQLVDSQATASTRALFSYLIDLYGTKVISGQQDDVDYIVEKTGKETAMGNFDLIEYSPSRVQYGSKPAGSTERYLNWAKKGEGRGLLSILWHWNAPTDLINQAPDKLWWSGFYTSATTFDLAAVLANKNGSKYQLLLRDIDVIADELKKFQEADIPVLWRPLHEASGGWFWWGAKGAGPFKELWHILYNRLTYHHHLHNLIWVYTGTTDLAWYPGDAYVDVVGLDIYTDASANMSGDWTGIQEEFNGRKLVALTETGNLPVPEKIRSYGTWWSWFSVWTGNDYIKKQPLDLLQTVYTHDDIITREELPDWRAYPSPEALLSIELTAPASGAEFFQCDQIVLKAEPTVSSGTVTKVVFRANGFEIGADADAQGGWQINWTGAVAGNYTITVEATHSGGTQVVAESVPLVVKPNCLVLAHAPEIKIPENGWEVYPNPVREGQLYVRVYANTPQEVTFTLLDSRAQPVLHMPKKLQVGTNTFYLQVQHASSGMYLLVANKEDQRLTTKVIISR